MFGESRLGHDGMIYINLDRRDDRRAVLEAHLAEMGIEAERFAGLEFSEADGFQTVGLRGNFLSYAAVVAIASCRGWRSVLVLEDDVEFRGDVKVVSRAALDALADVDWDILYYYAGDGRGPVTRIRQTVYGTHAVAVHQRCYGKFLEAARVAKLAPDVFLSEMNWQKYGTERVAVQRNRRAGAVRDSDTYPVAR